MVAYMYMHANLRKSNKITGRMDVDYDGVDASGGVYPIAGLEYWTGLLDWTTGLTCCLNSFASYR